MTSCEEYEAKSWDVELGPMNIDYLHIYYCSFNGEGIFSPFLFLLWSLFLIYLLGSTADAYFTPALSSICVKFRIPYQVAGVTLLAFGNGAPDVFASISAFTAAGEGGGETVLIGVGALLGATVFVASVVVAVIVIICPCNVDPYTFRRDVSFHLLSVVVMAIVAINRSVSLTMAWMFLLLYVIYVGVVAVGWYMERKLEEDAGGGGGYQEMEEVTGTVQAAYWHSSSSSSSISTTQNKTGGGSSTAGTTSGSGGYSFLLLGDTSLGGRGSSNNKNNSYNYNMLNKSKKNKKTKTHDKDQTTVYFHDEDDDDSDSDSSSDESDEGFTVNRTGGLIMPKFNHKIYDNHFAAPNSSIPGTVTKVSPSTSSSTSSTQPIASSSSTNSKFNQHHIPFKEEEDVHSTDHGSESSISSDLEAPLISSSSNEAEGNMGKQGSHALIASARDMMATNLYWQQWRLKRRVRQTIVSAEWWEYPWYWKMFAVVTLPFNICRDMSIPTVDEELWSKTYCTMQPICSPLLLLYTFGLWDSSVGFISAPVLCCFLGFPLSITVFVLTHASRPPVGDVLSTIWTFAAFIMCVVWIYFFAGELVSCLEAIGILSGIPPAVLGMTILAWGNSVGDLFANMAVAKQGLGQMAIAGSYGGPVLNLCVGLGVSFIYATSLSYPASFSLVIDISSVISIVFAILILSSTLAIVMYNHYEMTPLLGYYLIGVYILYTLIQLLALYFEMNDR